MIDSHTDLNLDYYREKFYVLRGFLVSTCFSLDESNQLTAGQRCFRNWITMNLNNSLCLSCNERIHSVSPEGNSRQLELIFSPDCRLFSTKNKTKISKSKYHPNLKYDGVFSVDFSSRTHPLIYEEASKFA
jgi:hypothetical protein